MRPAVIPELRQRFNKNMFSEESYQKLLSHLNDSVGMKIQFRVCETPVFVPKVLHQELKEASLALFKQLLTPEYLEASKKAIPAAFQAPNDQARPNFIQIDFAITRDAQGHFTPKLVELQAWPSIYAFQLLLPQAMQDIYPELKDLPYLFDGMSNEGFIDIFRRSVLGKHPAENVILMEIEPEKQKTLPDFIMTEKYLGIEVVCITKIQRNGKTLTYEKDGRQIEIKRIYNRAIVEELVHKNIQSQFQLSDDVNVEWAGHPNWFFRMSKYSLPFLSHPTVPKAWFLDQVQEIPADLENYVLKPLFSFAGSGVKINITREDIDAIPTQERGGYLLQEKISYEPIIETIDEPSKVEIRMMLMWPDEDAEPTVVTTLPRLAKGLLLGVDFNKNRTWVGSACCLLER
jgi:hypothetical protein